MQHAVLGSGGIGGLIVAALARAGADVLLLMRRDALARYGGRLTVETPFSATSKSRAAAASELEPEIDALWIAVKATQLKSALEARTI